MKYITTLCTIALLLIACGKQQPHYTLEGNTGTGNDTLYIYGMDDRHEKIDTVVTGADGDFRFVLPTDTVVPLTLILRGGTLLPVYAEPGTEATLGNENGRWSIKGGGVQTLHDSIVSKLDNITELSQRHEAIDSFIKQHPYSDVNIYLLWRYFVESDEARSSIIRYRIEMMGGSLQDNSYVASVKRAVSAKQQNIQHRSAPDFNLQALDGSTLKRSDYKDKYLMMTFWASWDSASTKYMRSLKELGEIADTAMFRMISVSLDYDTAAWKKAINDNTLPGSHVCDTKMWESSIVKEFTISRLPFSVLVNPYMRVEQFNVTPEWIMANADSLTTSYKDKLDKKKKASPKNKKVKSSKQTKPKEEPQKEHNSRPVQPRPRPGMKSAGKNLQVQETPQ